ncbi:prepilin-type N-terminal cleavage/methylation domain-containing protein [uncultured Pseudoteredinibacter sp.]|uniref:PulJ/GspJ family protein n=1 Tax=uncultured Pseudoteredinibacter sp. TaxID=1641701 RepID=UPI0026321645|nr:prepilin-type N-terminal cleavage/methylation domain-containing protein [uncultured Pseudoteredinibacter sp.]
MHFSAAKNSGFTLVELIAVIIIVAVIGSLGSSFFLQYLSSQQAMQQRIDLFSRSRLAINLISREVENALPNSVRATAGGQCVEFIPVIGGGILESEPPTNGNQAPASSELDLLAYSIDRGTANTVVIAAVSSTDIYSGAALGSLASPLATGQGSGTVNLSSPTVFSQSSSSRRVFFIAGSRAFCIYQGGLYEYNRAGVFAAAFAPSATGILVDSSVNASGGGFTVQSGALNNGAELNVDLVFTKGNAQFISSDRVYIRNVP